MKIRAGADAIFAVELGSGLAHAKDKKFASGLAGHRLVPTLGSSGV